MVMDSWVCGLAVVVFSVSGSKNSRVDTGLPDTSGDIWKGISISHCRDSNALESRHPPTSSSGSKFQNPRWTQMSTPR